MLCCCERDEQTSSRIMSDYNIDLGEWGVSSVPALMAKIVDMMVKQRKLTTVRKTSNYRAPSGAEPGRKRKAHKTKRLSRRDRAHTIIHTG